jgi:hypothetical protein
MAVGSQTGSVPYGVVLLLNNCTDNSLSIARRLIRELPIPVCVTSIDLSPKKANSGYARRVAMQKAAALANESAVLLTTDADGRVPPNWIDANLAIIENGVEVVAGRVELDHRDAQNIPTALHEDDARECHYGQLIDEIHTLLDPDPVDPWPRHSEHSGASLAVTLGAYGRAGGIPLVSPGEDRAFVEALKRTDARIRHSPEISVTVSGRIFGRAIGGMADTIRRRLVQPDSFLDEQLEPALDAVRRASLRRLFRIARKNVNPDAIQTLAKRLLLSESSLKRAMAARYFGTAWAEVERQSPALVRKRVLVSDLTNQSAKAASILYALRNEVPAKTWPTHRGGNTLSEPGALA